VHLRAVKLRGFKSFPDTVEVRLEPGVGVIVGPNGSGKSNVADAIRWAAGSLSPSELRAEKPDDVLFAGAANRGPADFCEVELLFDNSDRGIDVDFAELAITRRLHRGGEGQYLVNKTAVRRMDLVELLADLGLGQGMHSIIGQGKVEAILASKPEERRALIEEAAGLGRFKARKHRAELKLARVATQVERARDLEDEVRKRLRPLALQATAAERAEKLRGEIATLRARIAELDLASLDERLAEAGERKTAAQLARRAAEEKLEAVLAERGAAEEELADAAGRREQAMQALYRLRSAAERIGLRRESAAALLESVRGELADAESDAGGPTVEVAELEQTAREAAEAARVAAVEREARFERARQVLARLVAAERALHDAAHRQLDELLAQRAEIEKELTGAAGERESALSVSYELRSRAARLAVQRESATRMIERLRSELADAEADAARPGPSPEELEQQALYARAAARDAAHARDTLAERTLTAHERLATLERSLAEREGIPPAARALAEKGEHLALSLIDVEPGTERAVAAALGPRASALVAPTAEAALELLEKAAAAGLGSLHVLAGRDPRELVAELPVVDRADLLDVTVPSVTSEGYGYDPHRGELWFAGETAEAVLLELEARRAALATEAKQLAQQSQAAERAAEVAEQRAVKAEAAFAAAAPRLRLRRADVGTLRALLAAVSRLERALDTLDHAVDVVEAPLRARGEAGAERTAAIGLQLRELGVTESSLRRSVAAHAEGLTAAERDLTRLGSDSSRSEVCDPALDSGDAEILRMQSRTLVAEADAAASEAATLTDQARAAEADRVDAAVRAGRRRARPHQLARVLAGAERLDAVLGGAVEAADRFEAPLRARVDAGGARTGTLGEELRRLGAAEVELRQELTNASAGASAIDVEVARIEAEADEARRRLEHAGTDERAEGDDRDELAERAERLERRRESLGQVNPLAKEEYEAEKARLEELTTQRKDLEESLTELEKLCAELEETVERRFVETFDAVQSNFADVAATLFPGGEGRLQLIEPQDEESQPGIEVHLRPVGKKVQRLSLLSGGEKALGAISFLFALFLARPCPFYLLDEVEAALDDTNIGRFVALLRQYSDRAQFVVITHQKRTMEAADILYGVTMGGDGVSQIVSRRLPREEAEAVSAA
jgi:chromosome segregation protein